MPDQKNLIIAIVLSVAILAGFQFFYEIPRLEREAARRATVEQTQPTSPGQTTTDATSPVSPSSAPKSGVAVPGGAVVAPTKSAEDISKESPSVRIQSARLHGSISLRGGRIDNLTLADYKVSIEPNSPEVRLLSPVGSAEPYYVDFGWINAAGTSDAFPGGDTIWQSDRSVLAPGEPVTLTWDNGAGLAFSRRYDLDQNYMITVTMGVENNSASAVDVHNYGLISRHGTPETLGFFILHEGPLGVFNETLTEVDYDDLTEPGANRLEQQSTGGWIGITDKYWLTALVPDQQRPFTGSFNYAGGDTGKYQVDYLYGLDSVPAGGTASNTARVFLGAKEVRTLANYQDDLNISRFDLTIDWGWFPFLTKPLWWAIDYFNKLFGNFGVAIIVLTICVKFLFLPLAYKSYVSMSQMKRLQPEMVKLRERYGEDRQQLNQEMMALYKREKVNPVSGCLPMLLQIPVFFALYKVLFVTIEMRHQPFFGWIKDLSAPDPTTLFNAFGLIPWQPPEIMLVGIWPLLMGISMYLQQKMNPQPTDPVQAKVFTFLPLIFTFLLARFPAGLVIYWTCNNVLTMAQQWFIMRRTKTPKTT